MVKTDEKKQKEFLSKEQIDVIIKIFSKYIKDKKIDDLTKWDFGEYKEGGGDFYKKGQIYEEGTGKPDPKKMPQLIVNVTIIPKNREFLSFQFGVQKITPKGSEKLVKENIDFPVNGSMTPKQLEDVAKNASKWFNQQRKKISPDFIF